AHVRFQVGMLIAGPVLGITGKVINLRATIDGAAQSVVVVRIGNVAREKSNIRMIEIRPLVRWKSPRRLKLRAMRQGVNDVLALDQFPHQSRADEAASAGDEDGGHSELGMESGETEPKQ